MAIDIEAPGANEADLVAALRTLNLSVQTVEVTTGAPPVDITLADYPGCMTLDVQATSGGTSGVEILNFIGDMEPGRTLNVTFTSQTDPSDVINITQNGSGNISCIDNLGNSIGNFNVAIFDEEGNNIVFGFNGDVAPQYRWNCLYGTWDNPTIIAGKRNPMPQDGTAGQIIVADGMGDADWSSGPAAPFPVFNAGSVAALNTSYPIGSNARAMAVVFDADSPVVGSVVVGGGATPCVVIGNAASTDYVVMFVLP